NGMQRKSKHKSNRIPIGERVVIYPRGKKGIYQADFHCGGHRRVSLGTANLRAARRKAIEIEYRLQNCTYYPIPKNTIERKTIMNSSDAIAAFIEFQETEGNRRKTVVRYRGILEGFFEFMETLGVHKLEKVTLTTFDKYRAFRKPNLAPKTMHH